MIAIVIPTYNERDNIAILISRLERVLGESQYRIIIIDDSSPDGTAAVVRERQRTNQRIMLIERPGKLGLGTALKTGITRALKDGADRIIQMDADLSHPPEAIIQMLALSDADVIIGSRLVPGGKIEGWEWHRTALSTVANAVAHHLTGLEARDATGGFRCFQRRVFERVNLDAIMAEGYSFQIEMLWRCQRAGLTIREIPITFTNRRRGSSKISPREIWLAMQTVARLALSRWQQR